MAQFLKDGQQFIPPAHQNSLYPLLPHGGQSALYIATGGVVSAHGVYDDFHGVSSFGGRVSF